MWLRKTDWQFSKNRCSHKRNLWHEVSWTLKKKKNTTYQVINKFIKFWCINFINNLKLNRDLYNNLTFKIQETIFLFRSTISIYLLQYLNNCVGLKFGKCIYVFSVHLSLKEKIKGYKYPTNMSIWLMIRQCVNIIFLLRVKKNE